MADAICSGRTLKVGPKRAKPGKSCLSWVNSTMQGFAIREKRNGLGLF